MARAVTMTMAMTEIQTNPLPYSSRNSGWKAPTLTSQASRNAKKNEAMESSTTAPMNKPDFGALPGNGSPGTRGRIPISGSILPWSAGISHSAGTTPKSTPDMRISIPKPKPSKTSMDSGSPSTYSASSTPIQTLPRSTTADNSLSMKTTSSAPSTI